MAFWRSYDIIITGDDIIKDIRVSIRLNKEEHIKFKMLAIKNQKSMQQLLIDYVKKELKKEGEFSNEKKN